MPGGAVLVGVEKLGFALEAMASGDASLGGVVDIVVSANKEHRSHDHISHHSRPSLMHLGYLLSTVQMRDSKSHIVRRRYYEYHRKS